MKYKPSISVIMATHSGGPYLPEAINSILNQTFSDFEFIIINDAAKPETAELLNSYTDPRIKIIVNSENLGLTKSLNKGLSIAQAEYVARMDADDISLPQRFEVQKKFLDEHPDITVVGSATIIIDGAGKESGSKRPVTDPKLLKFYTMLKNQLTHSSVMFRKSTILKFNGYDESIKYAQDYDLWSRLLYKNVLLSNIEQPLLKYRFHQKSITQGTTKGKAYESAMKTVYKNISQYIAISQENFDIFSNSFHSNKVSSLTETVIVQKILGNFAKAYIDKEVPSSENIKKINDYIIRKKIISFRNYIVYRFGIPYRIIKNVKRIFTQK